MTTQRKPFLPEDLQRNGQPRDVVFRLAIAHCREHAFKRSILELLQDDIPTALLFRAASNPATLGTSGWASQFAATALEDMIVGLPGPSAVVEIIRHGTRVSFDGRAAIQIPSCVLSADDAGGFIAEGAPVPVRKRAIGSLTLSPFKLAVINEFSNETVAYSNFERTTRDDLSKAAVLQLDAQIFSSTAGSTSRPAGILNGVTPLTAATAGYDARSEDVRSLVNALAAAGGGSNVVFVCAPGQAAVMKDKVGPKFDYPILSAKALAAGTIVALEVSSFVFAFDPVPRFEVSDSAALHEEDTSPAALVTGTGPIIATPIRSLWQTNSASMKMIVPCSWGMRATGHVQIINNVNW